MKKINKMKDTGRKFFSQRVLELIFNANSLLLWLPLLLLFSFLLLSIESLSFPLFPFLMPFFPRLLFLGFPGLTCFLLPLGSPFPFTPLLFSLCCSWFPAASSPDDSEDAEGEEVDSSAKLSPN